MDWSVILFGVFLGLILLSACYNTALYAAMRERFLVWHSVRLFAMVAATLVSADVFLGSWLADAETRRQIKLFALDVAIGVAGPFFVAYLEPGALGKRLRLVLIHFWMPVLLVAPIPLLWPDSALANAVRHGTFTIILIAIVAALIQSNLRGSRSGRFQVAAWAGIVIVSSIAVGHELLYNAEWAGWKTMILVAMALEVIVTAVGISDRFRVIQHQRDEALVQATAAARAAATDPLTGIANRRGLQARLANARLPAPTGVAVLDIDYFKAINDEFGHHVGDMVLVALAGVLSGEGRFGARTGGEEFVLLLFDGAPYRAAEAIRCDIAAAIAEEVPGLGRDVTVSMGFCSIGDDHNVEGAMQLADKALYTAKRQGRDRSVATSPKSDRCPAGAAFLKQAA